MYAARNTLLGVLHACLREAGERARGKVGKGMRKGVRKGVRKATPEESVASSTAKKVAKRQRKLWLFHELTNRATCSGALSQSLPLSASLSCCSLETLVAGWLAHAFWIARQIYAPPLVCAGTGNGQRLRLASLGSVCLPASLCVHVSVSVWMCVWVCCLLAGFYQPFEGCPSLRVCVCNIAKNVVANLCVHYSFSKCSTWPTWGRGKEALALSGRPKSRQWNFHARSIFAVDSFSGNKTKQMNSYECIR